MKYRKKPVVIEAVQWHPNPETWEKIRELEGVIEDPCQMIVWYSIWGSLSVPTLKGDMMAEDGDWIIKGVHGEFYTCKPDIFEQTYEPVEG
jgi:hypothetical protein